MDLKEQVAIVTGGNRGIGKAIVLELSRLCAAVAFTYNKGVDEAGEVLREINDGEKGNHIAFQVDVTDSNGIEEIVKTVQQTFGRIDILINNAGIIKDSSLAFMPISDWHDVINTNLTGCFHTAKAVARTLMRQMHGKIVNISSAGALRARAGQTNYCASKMGLIGFTKSLAMEMAPYNITVNAIAPGFIDTDIVKHLKDNFRESVIKSIPLRRFGRPEEIARAVVFLVSEAADYITGQVICVDGGYSI